MRNLCKLTMLTTVAAIALFAETRELSLDFSVAPTKIEERRFPQAKNENVEYLLDIPAATGDFTFSCKLTPLGVRPYSGFAIGLGVKGMTGRQVKVRFRLGDGMRPVCGIYQGTDYKEIAKPSSGVKLEECIVKISWEAATSTLTYSATGKSGAAIIPESKVQPKFNQFQPDCVIVGVVDAKGAGESYLVYDAKTERLTGLSYLTKQFKSEFAVDDVKIEYK